MYVEIPKQALRLMSENCCDHQLMPPKTSANLCKRFFFREHNKHADEMIKKVSNNTTYVYQQRPISGCRCIRIYIGGSFAPEAKLMQVGIVCRYSLNPI